MKKQYNLVYVFMIVISILYTFPVVSADSSAKIVYSTYDSENSEWTNITIFPESFLVSSDNEFYNGLEGDYLLFPWWYMEDKIEEVEFFNLNIVEQNPVVVVQIELLDSSNTVLLNVIPNQVLVLTDFLDKLLLNAIGADKEMSYWPVDLSIGVMESYPEQYRVEVTIQRGIDFLDVVYSVNFTLIVADYDIFANYFAPVNGNITHIYKGNALLDYGGQSVTKSLPNFMGSVEYRPSDLQFFVVLQNGMSIKSTTESPIPEVGYSNLDISDFKISAGSKLQDPNSADDESEGLDLPLDFKVFIFGFAILPIIRKISK